MIPTLDPEYLDLFPGPYWVDHRAVSELPMGPGSSLWKYWTAGKGFAQWSGAVHKWTRLNELLKKAGVPKHSVDGLTTNIIEAVFPGYMKTTHGGKTHKKAG